MTPRFLPSDGFLRGTCILALGTLLVAAARCQERARPRPSAGLWADLQNYSCTITTTVRETNTAGLLHEVASTQQRVIRRGAAYQVQRLQNGHRMEWLFNNGDGSNTEFEYKWKKNHAQFSLATIRYQYATRFPDRWRRNGQKPVSPPRGHQFMWYGDEQSMRQGMAKFIRRPGVTASFTRVGDEIVAGKRCEKYVIRVSVQSGHRATPEARSVHPDDLGGENISWRWPEKGILLRSLERRIVALATATQPQKVRETLMEVRNLQLGPVIDPKLFSPPTGTTYLLREAYPITAPPGEKVILFPGLGLSFPGDPGNTSPVRGGLR